MATAKQIEALVEAAEKADGVLRELYQTDEAAELAEALEPFLFPNEAAEKADGVLCDLCRKRSEARGRGACYDCEQGFCEGGDFCDKPLTHDRCPYCAGTGEAFDPATGEGPRCPACDGTGDKDRKS